MRRIRSRPSKPVSALAALVGLAFVVFGALGCFYIFPSEVPWIGKAFIGLWTIVAAGIFVYHCSNVFSSSGVADEILEIEGPGPEALSHEARLRRLADLRTKGLITESEHEQQRKKILEDL